LDLRGDRQVPIAGKRVLNMGSLSPRYEATFIHFAHLTTT
jgi:hypothetical protein